MSRRGVPASVADVVAGIKLVDGHCHAVLSRPVDLAGFELASTEADVPAPPGVSYLDGAAGAAIRRWCPPVLGLAAGAPVEDYLDRRRQLGIEEVTRRLLGAAELSHLLIDTGLGGEDLTGPLQLGDLAGAEEREVVRLEHVAERLASEGIAAGDFASAYTDALDQATRDAVAVKTILAYRGGFAGDLDRPSPTEVQDAAARWLGGARIGRMDEPVLIRFLLWCGVDRGLPIQVHTGFGDRDLQLSDSNPVLLQPFLSAAEPTGVPVILLHCYPFQRQAGWLAQVYPHVYVDVGLTVAQVGVRADVVLGEFFELAPFGKLLFSSDGYALPELYLVGAAQFRHSLTTLLGAWLADGAIQPGDAERLAMSVGSTNARRVYRL
jgi:predicted TIM-barrel fold metal-dependent hydrolase